MELSVAREQLAEQLGRCQSVVEKRSSMPILSNVLLNASGEELKLVATDLEITVTTSCPARISREGALTVPARKLYEIVRTLPGEEVYLKEKDNEYLHITAGRASYDLVGMNPADFPEPPQLGSVAEVELGGEVLAEMVDKTIFCVSTEDTRFTLAGVYVQRRELADGWGIRMVATDGHRLSLIERPVEGAQELNISDGVIIPRKGVAELRRLAEGEDLVWLGLNEEMASARTAQATVGLKLQEGSFPDYEVVIPKAAARKVGVGRVEFSEALKRVALMATDRFQGVKMRFTEGVVELVSQNPELGEAREVMEVEYSGEEFTVAFNARYFIELCAAMRSEQITLGFVEPTSPCLITGEGDPGFLSVIMPMRL